MRKGISFIYFNSFTFEDVDTNQKDRSLLLEELIVTAAGFDMSYKFDEVRHTVAEDYPAIPIVDGTPLHRLLFWFFNSCFTEDYDTAIKWAAITPSAAKLDMTDPTILSLCKIFHYAGVQYYAAFKAKYGVDFEQALSQHLYSPDKAWLVGCEDAGLPVDVWAEDFPELVFALGYFIPGCVDSMPSRPRAVKLPLRAEDLENV